MTRAPRLVAGVALCTGITAALPGAPASAEPAPDHDPPSCAPQQVVMSAVMPPPVEGHSAVTLVFALAPGTEPCTIRGYPRVEAVGGGPFDHARPTLRGYVGGMPVGVDGPPNVTLSASQQAQSVLEATLPPVLVFGGPVVVCPSYSQLRVTPPDGTQAGLLAVQMDGCQLQVHPVTPVTIEPGPPAPPAPPAPPGPPGPPN